MSQHHARLQCQVQAVIVQEEHREKEQSLKHTSALSGVGALASVVESDPTSRRFFEELFDLDNLVREIQGIPKQETSPDIAAMSFTFRNACLVRGIAGHKGRSRRLR